MTEPGLDFLGSSLSCYKNAVPHYLQIDAHGRRVVSGDITVPCLGQLGSFFSLPSHLPELGSREEKEYSGKKLKLCSLMLPDAVILLGKSHNGFY